jgi:hypothetical protein
MATRSHIGIRNLNGTIDYIYCHFDGYPSHNGKILTEYYDTVDKVRELLDLGDLSILNPEIGEKQDFDDRSTHNSNWCLAYGRDRNEPNTEFKTERFDDLLKDGGVDYIYVFDGDYWECFDTFDLKREIKLYNNQTI